VKFGRVLGGYVNSEYVSGDGSKEPWSITNDQTYESKLLSGGTAIEIGTLSCNRFGLITAFTALDPWFDFISIPPGAVDGMNISQLLPGFDVTTAFSENTLGPGYVGSSYIKIKSASSTRNQGYRVAAIVKRGEDCAPNEYSVALFAQTTERDTLRVGSVSSRKLVALTARFTEIIASIGEQITEEPQLVSACIDSLLGSGIFHAAWLGTESFSTGCFDIVDAAGAGAGEMKNFKIPVQVNDHLTPLSSKAYASNSLCYNNDQINAPGLGPWRDFFIAHRWRSVIAMPVGEAVAESVLVAASPISNLFQPHTLEAMVTINKLIVQSLRLLRQQQQATQFRQNTLWLSTHDQVTSLANRAQFENVLFAKTKQTKTASRPFALCLLDIDDLRSINSMHGTEVGDQLIVHFSKALIETFEDFDSVFRVSGDQFAVIVDNTTDPKVVLDLFDTLTAAAQLKITPLGTISYTWTTGVAFFPADGCEFKEILRSAEQALYSAKKSETKCASVNFYSELGGFPKVNSAFRAGDAFLLYQPIISLQTREVVGFEALTRWKIDHRTLTPPDFLNQLDKREARDFRRAVFKEALAAQQRNRIDKKPLFMSINTTPDDLADPNFATELLSLLPSSSDPKDIVLEILETGEILASQIAYANIAQMRAFGIRVALDDVGSGYSSLLRFRELPIDEIKIDKGFARDILHSPKNLAFFDTIVQLGNGVGVDIVAEGAETPLHVEALSQTGVGFLQGYGISRPMPENKIRDFAQNYRLDMADSSQMWFGALLDHLRLLGRLTQDVKIPHRRLNLVQELTARCSLDNWMNIQPERFGNLTLIRESHTAFHTLAHAVVESAEAGSFMRLEKLADMARMQATQMVELMTIELTKQKDDPEIVLS